MTKLPGACPLCLEVRRTSMEDVLPQWTRPIVAELSGASSRQLPPRVKTKVCEVCNDSMNRVFEIPSKPSVSRLIRGENFVLSAADARLAARWMLKTAIMWLFREQSNPGGLRADYFNGARRVLLRMMDTESAPPRFAGIRAGLILPEVGDNPGFLVARTFEIPEITTRVPPGPVVLSLGHLLWETLLILGGETRIDATDVGVDARLSRMWPVAGDVEWPPPEPIQYGDWLSLKEDWGAGTEEESGHAWAIDPHHYREPGRSRTPLL